MKIDIRRTVYRIQLRRFITLIAVVVIVIFIFLLGNRNILVLGLNKYSWGLVVGLLYLIFLIAESFLDLNYIYFSDDSNDLVLRYFSMSIFSRTKKSIEIPKEDFDGYEITSSMWGYKKNIKLIQRFKKESAKYPTVSLSGLSEKELNVLLKTLDKYK